MRVDWKGEISVNTKEYAQACKQTLRARHKSNRAKGCLCPEWQNFEDFYTWAMAQGFTPESRIMRLDEKLPASPGNCRVVKVGQARKEKTAVMSENFRAAKVLSEANPCNGCQRACSGAVCDRAEAFIHEAWRRHNLAYQRLCRVPRPVSRVVKMGSRTVWQYVAPYLAREGIV